MINQDNVQFSDYAISDGILEALKALGYNSPTNIQKEVLPVLLAGKNVVVKAPTGSGKTAAFAIPICESIESVSYTHLSLVGENDMAKRKEIYKMCIRDSGNTGQSGFYEKKRGKSRCWEKNKM